MSNHVTRRAVNGPLVPRMRLWRRTIREGSRLSAPFRVTGRGASNVLECITIGTGTRIGQFAWFSLTSPEARIEIGANCTLNSSFSATVRQRLTIDDGTAIGDRFMVMDHEHDNAAYVERALAEGDRPAFAWDVTEPRPVHIGSGIHIGVNVVVLPGVEIGDGCVIGANSVVTRSIPPYSVAAGVPAKVLRAVHGPTS